MKKNLFLTFVFACCPGAGQMYLGHMKRGLSLMFLFFGTIGFVAIARMPVLSFIVPIIWFYSFFDTFHIRNASEEELEQIPDRFLLNVEDSNLRKKLFGKKNMYLGIVLVVIGVYIFAVNILPEEIREPIARYFPTLVITILLIVSGIKMMAGDQGEK